jgi:hypothetical protein
VLTSCAGFMDGMGDCWIMPVAAIHLRMAFHVAPPVALVAEGMMTSTHVCSEV